MSADARPPADPAAATPESPAPDTEPVDQRLRLICDLADALAKQTQWVEEHWPARAPGDRDQVELIAPLAQRTALVREAAGRLRKSLDAGAPSSRREPNAAPKREAATAHVTTVAESVALEMKVDGVAREAVESFLRGEFGLDNAREIVDLVYGLER